MSDYVLLATSAPDPSKLKYPVFASFKMDGVRAITTSEGLMSRKMKPIPNKSVQQVAKHWPVGLDGELVMRNNRTAPLREVTSAVMSVDGFADVEFVCFDFWKHPGLFNARYNHLMCVWDTCAEQRLIHSAKELDEMFREAMQLGYEGLILRNPRGHYKFGRSTVREALSLKMKLFEDLEAEVIGYKEETENTNPRDEDGKRSSDKMGKIGKDRLGALLCVYEGQEFDCGSGFTEDERIELWKTREQLIGQYVTVKHQPPFMLNRPRFPVFKGFRNLDF